MSSLSRLFSGIFKNAGDDVADKIASNFNRNSPTNARKTAWSG